MTKNILHGHLPYRTSYQDLPPTFLSSTKIPFFAALAVIPPMLRSSKDSPWKTWGLRLTPVIGIGALLFSSDAETKTTLKVSLCALGALCIGEWRARGVPPHAPKSLAPLSQKEQEKAEILTFLSSKRAFIYAQAGLEAMLETLHKFVNQLQDEDEQELLNTYKPKYTTLQASLDNIGAFCPLLAFGIVRFESYDEEYYAFQELQVAIFKDWVRRERGEMASSTLFTDLQKFCKEAKHSYFKRLETMLDKMQAQGATNFVHVFQSIMDLTITVDIHDPKNPSKPDALVLAYYKERRTVYDSYFSPEAMRSLFLQTTALSKS